MVKKLAVLFVGLLMLSPYAMAEQFSIDTSHSQVHFTVSHLMFSKVRGSFTEFSGSIEADPKMRTIQSIKGVVKASSIDTRQNKRDDHLRSKDFFYVERYPQLAFESKEISGSGDSISVTGDLTIRGVTKSVTFTGKFIGSGKDPWGNFRAGFEATSKINRTDFGLKWNKALETGGFVVGEEVEIGLEVEAIQKK